MSISDLPLLNASLNFIAAVLLAIGYYNIKQGREDLHRKFMISALITSAMFLSSYVIYHYNAGSTQYPYDDWSRYLYFAILIPHVILAALQVPFILYIVYHAFRSDFEKHRRIARFVFPVWMYVSVTGVLIYLMLNVF